MYSHLAFRSLNSRLVQAVLGVAVAFFLFGSSARANIDPASDVLLQQHVFLPYQPRVCGELSNTLTKLTDRVRKEGYPLKVAVIASEADLGGAPQYFGRQQDYARFLGSEIGIGNLGGAGVRPKESLLTVMQDGFGFARSPQAANVSLVVPGLDAPKGSDPNDLARATIRAIPQLAKAAGHPVPVPKVSSKCSSGGGGTSPMVYISPIALILIAGGVIFFASRRQGYSD
jgi:hypothetical protein